jgi:hypothetical protein
VIAENRPEIAAIERFIGQTIPRVKLEGFPYKYTRLLEDRPPPFGQRGRRSRSRW